MGFVVRLYVAGSLRRQPQEAEHLHRDRPGAAAIHRQGAEAERVLADWQLMRAERQVEFLVLASAEVRCRNDCFAVEFRQVG